MDASESTALTVGAEGKEFQEKAWEEIMTVLREQSEGLDEAF